MAEANRSVEAFSAAVAAIYDCALNPDAWQQALRRVGELIDSPCLCLSITDYAQQSVAYCVNHGYDPLSEGLFREVRRQSPLQPGALASRW
jgi:hypothetical protein